MQFLKQYWLQIRAFLDQLSLDTKLLILSLLVILAFAGFVIMQYAGSSEMAALPQFTPDRQQMVLARLEAAGIRTQAKGPVLLVPQAKLNDAWAVLAQYDLTAVDTSAAFDEMIKRQSPWDSESRNRQAFMLAKQKVLGQIIGKMTMAGVRSADVMISLPEDKGFGKTYSRPSASVNVYMDGRTRMNQRLVEAIAGLVSGAVAPMEPRDVVVIDANNGRQFTVKSAEDIAPNETLELVQAQEDRYRDKIERLLSYIPGVIVAVNVRTDPTLMRESEQFTYETSEPLKSQFDKEQDRRNIESAGEAGARPNIGLDIAGGSGSQMIERVTESRSEYDKKNLTERTIIRTAGRTAKEVSVTVNVPRPYFVSLYRQANPQQVGVDGQVTEPDDAALRPIIDEQLRMIESQVEPQISTDATGLVRAHMIPDPSQMILAMNPRQPTTGMMMVLGQDWLKPAGLALLSLLSLALMFGMVRKATQQPQLPTVEELAGLPPMLPMDDDMIGEASEDDAAMAGVEVDEDEIRSRRIAEQISQMIKANPAEAANLVGRWVRTED